MEMVVAWSSETLVSYITTWRHISRWRQHGAPKLWYPTTALHGVRTQKTSTWFYLMMHTNMSLTVKLQVTSYTILYTYFFCSNAKPFVTSWCWLSSVMNLDLKQCDMYCRHISRLVIERVKLLRPDVDVSLLTLFHGQFYAHPIR